MKLRFTIVALALVSVFSQKVSAQYPDPSPVPFTSSFESLGLNDSILTNPAAGSWAGTLESKAFVTNAAIAYSSANPLIFPLPSETHTNILRFETDGSISNSFTNSFQNLWVDTMVQPVLSEDVPLNSSVSNSQLSVCFGTNGCVSIFHGVQTNGQTGLIDTSLWSTFTDSSFRITSSGQWVRLTIELHYDLDFTYAMFKAQVDGIALSNEFGYSGNDLQTASKTGSWFICANDTSLEAGLRLNEIALSGSGYLDDLFVSTNAPVFLSEYFATNGVPYSWLVAHGVGTNNYYTAETWDQLAVGDQDGDGMYTWEEWVAGTEPTDSNSLLKVLNQTVSNGFPVISWLSSTNTLNGAPYLLQSSSNLLVGAGWAGFTNIPANVPGTNTLTVTPPPETTPTFFRVTITN